jgi:hypothetical protein
VLGLTTRRLPPEKASIVICKFRDSRCMHFLYPFTSVSEQPGYRFQAPSRAMCCATASVRPNARPPGLSGTLTTASACPAGRCSRHARRAQCATTSLHQYGPMGQVTDTNLQLLSDVDAELPFQSGGCGYDTGIFAQSNH